MTGPGVAERLQPKEPADKAAIYSSIKGIGIAAAGMQAPGRVFSHAALLYRWKNEVRMFEMRSHKELRDAPAAQAGFVWIEPAIPLERMQLVGIKARLVHQRHKENAVPYGFKYRASSFDEKGGLRIGQGEIGFTCSTIVAAILESEQVRLLDPATWPSPDKPDKDGREAFLTELEKTDPEHVRLLRADIEAPRISPEEVVAAAAIVPKVGTFENVQEGAAEVRKRIGTT